MINIEILDLNEMRKIKIENQVLNLLNRGIKLLDQQIINAYFCKYIGLLPPKFNTYLFSYNEVVIFNNNSGKLYDNDYLYYSFKFPSIRHFVGSNKYLYNQKEWIYYAKKSKYFRNITNNLTYTMKNITKTFFN